MPNALDNILSTTFPGALPGSPSNVYNASALNTLGVTAASGTPGAGPGIVVAIDNTLGSFSPFEGRFYIAYTGIHSTPTPARTSS